MAVVDFNGIASSEYATGSPLTTSLAARWSRNCEAIAQGGTGAPRVQLAALGDDLAAGDVVVYGPAPSLDTEKIEEGTSAWATALRLKFWQAGVVRVSFQHLAWAGEGTSRARVRVGGLTQAEWTTGSGSWQSRAVDVTVARGDVVDVLHRLDGADNGANPRYGRMQSAAFSTDGAAQLLPLSSDEMFKKI